MNNPFCATGKMRRTSGEWTGLRVLRGGESAVSAQCVQEPERAKTETATAQDIAAAERFPPVKPQRVVILAVALFHRN
jgi:hypothetical protein